MTADVPFPVAVHRLRVMYADGEVQDFLTSVQDSRFLGFAVEHHYGKAPGKFDRIVGTADLGEVYIHSPVEPTPVSPAPGVPKRVQRVKKATH